MPEDKLTGLPVVCLSSSIQSTYIQLLNYTTASLPPIQVSKNITNYHTRQWGSYRDLISLTGGTIINLYYKIMTNLFVYMPAASGMTATLRMATIYTLICPICVQCSGSIYFSFGSSLSNAIGIFSSSGYTTMATEILGEIFLYSSQRIIHN